MPGPPEGVARLGLRGRGDDLAAELREHAHQLGGPVLDEEIDLRRDALSPAADPKTMARRYRRLLDSDRDWTLALLEFTIHAARRPALATEMKARNDRVREITRAYLAEIAPQLSAKEARIAAKLVMAVHSGVALERALDRDGAGDAQLELAYRAALGE